MFNYKGIVLLPSETKLAPCTPGNTANVCIDLFILECFAGTHQITENFKFGTLIRNPEGKDMEILPNKYGMPKRAQLEMFCIREKLGTVPA